MTPSTRCLRIRSSPCFSVWVEAVVPPAESQGTSGSIPEWCQTKSTVRQAVFLHQGEFSD